MSWFEWAVYVFIGTLGVGTYVGIVGLRRCLDVRRAASWFLFFFAMTYWVRPPLAYLFGSGYSYAESLAIPLTHLWVVSVLFSLALFVFALAYVWFSPDPNAAVFRSRLPVASDGIVELGGYGLMVIGYLFLYLGPQQSAVLTFSGGAINPDGNSYLQLMRLLVPAGLVLVASSGRSAVLCAGLAAPFVVTTALAAYNRYTFLIFVVAFALALLLRRARPLGVGGRIVFGAVAAALFGTFVTVGANRAAFVQGTTTLVDSFAIVRSEFVDRVLGDFAGFEGTALTVASLESADVTYGARIVYNVLVVSVPRSLWPEKPLPPEFTWEGVTSGRWSTEYSGQEFMLFSNSQVRGHIGYSLEDWGWALWWLDFLVAGALYGWAERWFFRWGHLVPVRASYVVLVALLVYSGRNMVADNFMRFAIYFFAPYLVLQAVSHVARGASISIVAPSAPRASLLSLRAKPRTQR